MSLFSFIVNYFGAKHERQLCKLIWGKQACVSCSSAHIQLNIISSHKPGSMNQKKKVLQLYVLWKTLAYTILIYLNTTTR